MSSTKKSIFGRAVETIRSVAPGPLGKKKADEPPKPEVRLKRDTDTLRALSSRLVAAGGPSGSLIDAALSADASAVAAAQTKVDAALALSDAANRYAEARRSVPGILDAVRALTQSKHPLIAKPMADFGAVLVARDKAWADAGDVAAAAAAAQALEDATAELQKSAAARDKALRAADEKIRAAETALARMSALGSLDLSAATAKIQSARQAWSGADDLAAIGTAVGKLDKYEDDLKDSAKGKAPQAGLAALDTYREKRKGLNDQIAKAGLLRGATSDTEMCRLISDAVGAIDAADQLLANAGSSEPATVAKEATSLMAAHADLLKAATERSSELKKLADKDNESLPGYRAAWDQLQRAVAALDTLPGSPPAMDAIRRKLATAMATHPPGPTGVPAAGYAAALKALKGLGDAALKEARDASAGYVETLTAGNSPLKPLLERVDSAMKLCEECEPPARYAMQQKARAAAIGSSDPIAALTALADELTGVAVSARLIDTQVGLMRKEVAKLAGQLQGQGAPSTLMTALNDTATVDRLRSEHAYGEALGHLQQLRDEGRQALADAQGLRTAWDAAKKELGPIAGRANRLAGWPVFAARANGIANDCHETLERGSAGNDLASLTSSVARLKQRVELLEADAEAANLEPGVDLAPFRAMQEKVAAEWTQWDKALNESMRQLQERLEAARDPSINNPPDAAQSVFGRRLDALRATARNAMHVPKLQKGESPASALRRIFDDQVKAEAKRVLEELNALAQQPQQMASLKQNLELPALHGQISERLRQFEAGGGDGIRYRRAIGDRFDPTIALALSVTNDWKAIDKALKDALKQQFVELNARRKAGQEALKAVTSKLNKLFDLNEQRFAELYRELRMRSEDTRVMLEVNEPNVIAAGLAHLEELKSLIEGALGEGPATADGKTFKEVVDLWTELSHLLGDKALVEYRLPVTYVRLRAKLNDAIAQAKRVAPTEGWQILEALRQPLLDAVDQAKGIAKRYEVFVAQKESLESRLEALHANTRTRFTDTTPAFDAAFASRLAVAHEAARQEGQMDKAFEMLGNLGREIEGLMSEADPAKARSALQRLDGRAAEDQRELRDLARDWNQKKAYLVNELVPAVEKAIATRSDGASSSSDLSDLKGAASRAGISLKAYLSVLDTVKIGVNVAPDMDLARRAFMLEQQKLNTLENTARRLMTGGSTGADHEADLRKLEAEWIGRVARADASLKKLAATLRSMPAQRGSDPVNAATYLDDEQFTQFERNAQALAAQVIATSQRFDPTAFSAPLEVLTRKGNAEAGRLKAREDALRTMRALRDDIVGNELLRELFASDAQQALGAEVAASFGLLRSTLKRLELSILVAA